MSQYGVLLVNVAPRKKNLKSITSCNLKWWTICVFVDTDKKAWYKQTV